MAENRLRLGMDILSVGHVHYLLQTRFSPQRNSSHAGDGEFVVGRKSDRPCLSSAPTAVRAAKRSLVARQAVTSVRGSRESGGSWSARGLDPLAPIFAPTDFDGRPVLAVGMATISELFSRRTQQTNYRMGGTGCSLSLDGKVHPPDSLHLLKAKTGKKSLPKYDPVHGIKAFSQDHIPIQFRQTFSEWDKLCYPGDDFGLRLNDDPNHLKVATLNVGGLNGDKLLFVAWYFSRLAIDVLFLQDTQLTAVDAVYKHSDFKDILGYIYVSSTGSASTGQFTRVGGQTVLVSTRWAKHVSRFKADESGMGVVAELELMTGVGRLLLIGTYWPYDSEMLAGLMGGLESWMASCTPPRRGDPMSYIKMRIERVMFKHLTDLNNSFILVGDFNSCYHKDGSQHSCKAWADDCGLVNTIADRALVDNLIFRTRYMGELGTGFIDHVMHNPRLLTMCAFGSSAHAGWSNCRIDHRPVYACYTILGGTRDLDNRPSKFRRSLTSTKINKDSAEQTADLQSGMTTFCEGKAEPDMSIV